MNLSKCDSDQQLPGSYTSKLQHHVKDLAGFHLQELVAFNIPMFMQIFIGDVPLQTHKQDLICKYISRFKVHFIVNFSKCTRHPEKV